VEENNLYTGMKGIELPTWLKSRPLCVTVLSVWPKKSVDVMKVLYKRNNDASQPQFSPPAIKAGVSNSNWSEGHILEIKCFAGRSLQEKSFCGPQYTRKAINIS
jgi:hypothetical protein